MLLVPAEKIGADGRVSSFGLAVNGLADIVQQPHRFGHDIVEFQLGGH